MGQKKYPLPFGAPASSGYFLITGSSEAHARGSMQNIYVLIPYFRQVSTVFLSLARRFSGVGYERG